MNKEAKYISYMELAISEAKKAQKFGEVPIGAVVVDSLRDQVITKNHNRVLQLKDPTAHAELLVIRDACKLLNTERIVDCSLYVTLEPCAMCAAAISYARIKNLYYGADSNGNEHFSNGLAFFDSNVCNHKPNIYGGISEVVSTSIIHNFFNKMRKGQNK